MLNKKIAAALALVVTALTFAATESRALSIEAPKPNEPVALVKVVRSDGETKSVDLQVKAFFGGCGKSDDFNVIVTNTNNQQRVRIVRLRDDPCELFAPDGRTFTLRTDKLDVSKPFYIDNPVFVSARM